MSALTPEQEAKEREMHDKLYPKPGLSGNSILDANNLRMWQRGTDAYLARAAITHEREERLMQYVQHVLNCAKHPLNEVKPKHEMICTCGLDAALAKEG